jgi:hypothetical protein
MSEELDLGDAILRVKGVRDEMDPSGVSVSVLVNAVLGLDSDEEMEELVEAAMASREGLPISDMELTVGIINLYKWRCSKI